MGFPRLSRWLVLSLLLTAPLTREALAEASAAASHPRFITQPLAIGLIVTAVALAIGGITVGGFGIARLGRDPPDRLGGGLMVGAGTLALCGALVLGAYLLIGEAVTSSTGALDPSRAPRMLPLVATDGVGLSLVGRF